MFKYLMDMNNYETLAAMSTVFFFLLFIGIVIGVLFMRRQHTVYMEKLPLDEKDYSIQEERE